MFLVYRHGWDGNRDDGKGEGKEGSEEECGEMHLRFDLKLSTS